MNSQPGMSHRTPQSPTRVVTVHEGEACAPVGRSAASRRGAGDALGRVVVRVSVLIGLSHALRPLRRHAATAAFLPRSLLLLDSQLNLFHTFPTWARRLIARRHLPHCASFFEGTRRQINGPLFD
jgi:hypothetical protein